MRSRRHRRCLRCQEALPHHRIGHRFRTCRRRQKIPFDRMVGLGCLVCLRLHRRPRRCRRRRRGRREAVPRHRMITRRRMICHCRRRRREIRMIGSIFASVVLRTPTWMVMMVIMPAELRFDSTRTAWTQNGEQCAAGVLMENSNSPTTMRKWLAECLDLPLRTHTTSRELSGVNAEAKIFTAGQDAKATS